MGGNDICLQGQDCLGKGKTVISLFFDLCIKLWFSLCLHDLVLLIPLEPFILIPALRQPWNQPLTFVTQETKYSSNLNLLVSPSTAPWLQKSANVRHCFLIQKTECFSCSFVMLHLNLLVSCPTPDPHTFLGYRKRSEEILVARLCIGHIHINQKHLIKIGEKSSMYIDIGRVYVMSRIFNSRTYSNSHNM